MKRRIPAPTKHFVGYTRELEHAKAWVEGSECVLITGDRGIGKSEFVFKLSEQLVPKLKYKPFFLKIDREMGSKDLAESLVRALPKATIEESKLWSADEILDEVFYFFEKRKHLLVLEDVDKLEGNVFVKLIEYCQRYFRNSRLVVTANWGLAEQEKIPSWVKSIKLEGLSTEEAKQLYQSQKVNFLPPLGIVNPQLLQIVSLSPTESDAGKSVSRWLEDQLSKSLFDHLMRWKVWDRIPFIEAEKLPEELRELTHLLLNRRLLEADEREIRVASSISPYIDMTFYSGNFESQCWAILSEASPRNCFYEHLSGKQLSLQKIEGYLDRLLETEDFEAFLRFQKVLRDKGVFLEKYVEKEIDHCIDSEFFPRVSQIFKQIDSPDLDFPKSRNLMKRKCQLNYHQKDMLQFKKSVEQYKKYLNRIGIQNQWDDIELCHFEALVCRENQKYKDAIKIRRHAIERFSKDTPYIDKFNHFFHLGLDLSWVADFSSALEYCERAKNLAAENHKVSHEQIAYYNMWYCLDELGKKKQAKEILNDLEAWLITRPNPSLKVSTIFSRFFYLYLENNLMAALDLLLKNKSNILANATKNQQIAFYLYLAEVYIVAGLVTEADKVIQEVKLLISDRGRSQYYWRTLRLMAEKNLVELGQQACRELIAKEAPNLNEDCEVGRERLILMRLKALSADKNGDEAINEVLNLYVENASLEGNYSRATLLEEIKFYQKQEVTYSPNAVEYREKYYSDRILLFKQLNQLEEVISGKVLSLSDIIPKESPWQYSLNRAIDSLQLSYHKLYEDVERSVVWAKTHCSITYKEKTGRLARAFLSIAGLNSSSLKRNWSATEGHLKDLKAVLFLMDELELSLAKRTFLVFENINPLFSECLFDHIYRAEKDLCINWPLKIVIGAQLNIMNLGGKSVIYDLFKLFIDNKGNPFDRDFLVKEIWNQEYDPERHDQLIYVNLGRLKKLMESELALQEFISRDGDLFFVSDSVQFMKL